ncbi:hypothetical protein GCM10009609_55950 [Pseudonocardia aurantiaca]
MVLATPPNGKTRDLRRNTDEEGDKPAERAGETERQPSEHCAAMVHSGTARSSMTTSIRSPGASGATARRIWLATWSMTAG